jgi:hypothetical protein
MSDNGNQIVLGRRLLSKDAMGLSVLWNESPIDGEHDRSQFSAIIVGVSCETFAMSLNTIQAIRKECQYASCTKIFLFAWFPDADRTGKQLLFEMGVDRIVWKTKQIPEALRQIYELGTRSHLKTHPWLERMALSRLF